MSIIMVLNSCKSYLWGFQALGRSFSNKQHLKLNMKAYKKSLFNNSYVIMFIVDK